MQRVMDWGLTAIIEREGDGNVALCPGLDVASQGASVEEARGNLKEALELFFESADPAEVAGRLHPELFVTQLEVSVAQAARVLDHPAVGSTGGGVRGIAGSPDHRAEVHVSHRQFPKRQQMAKAVQEIVAPVSNLK